MTRWFQNVPGQLQGAAELLADRLQRSLRESRASRDFVWGLRNGAERWHAAVRQMDPKTSIADILRTRTARADRVGSIWRSHRSIS